jgi:hypothetical protein
MEKELAINKQLTKKMNQNNSKSFNNAKGLRTSHEFSRDTNHLVKDRYELLSQNSGLKEREHPPVGGLQAQLKGHGAHRFEESQHDYQFEEDEENFQSQTGIEIPYSQTDLQSNRKRLFDTTEPKSTSERIAQEQFDEVTDRGGKKSDRNLSSSDVQNGYQSQSKYYMTFRGQGKENIPVPANENEEASSKAKDIIGGKHNYADRYLLMMKNRGKHQEIGKPRSRTPKKSEKKRSLFDEIRNQAVSRVHGMSHF